MESPNSSLACLSVSAGHTSGRAGAESSTTGAEVPQHAHALNQISRITGSQSLSEALIMDDNISSGAHDLGTLHASSSYITMAVTPYFVSGLMYTVST